MYPHSTVGTLTAMENVALITAGTAFIMVTWDLKYTPISIEHFTQCYLVCDVKTYYQDNASIPVETNILLISGLRPGSICEMRLLALFNPARLDSGMDHVFWTLPSSKYSVIGLNLPSNLNIPRNKIAILAKLW